MRWTTSGGWWVGVGRWKRPENERGGRDREEINNSEVRHWQNRQVAGKILPLVVLWTGRPASRCWQRRNEVVGWRREAGRRPYIHWNMKWPQLTKRELGCKASIDVCLPIRLHLRHNCGHIFLLLELSSIVLPAFLLFIRWRFRPVTTQSSAGKDWRGPLISLIDSPDVWIHLRPAARQPFVHYGHQSTSGEGPAGCTTASPAEHPIKGQCRYLRLPDCGMDSEGRTMNNKIVIMSATYDQLINFRMWGRSGAATCSTFVRSERKMSTRQPVNGHLRP